MQIYSLEKQIANAYLSSNAKKSVILSIYIIVTTIGIIKNTKIVIKMRLTFEYA